MSRLSPVEILIRETAQNSWDARVGGEAPRYSVSSRRAGEALRSALESALGAPANLGLDEAWRDPELRVVEISDRGTTGLDGPYRLGASPEGSTENYKDLILKLGVPRTDGEGGGTYGFGKTAAYAFSRRGTLVYWTRCLHEGRLQHRLVASAMGESYMEGSDEYTGRHWWGAAAEDGSILPLLDAEAQAIGELLFETGFDGDETGTSILVIDPRLDGETGAELTGRFSGAEDSGEVDELELTSETFGEAARRAIRQNLWPKLTPDPVTGRVPMDIVLRLDGAAVDLGSPEEGAWRHWADALNAIRIERAAPGEEPIRPVPRTTLVIPVLRYSEVVGHLAIARRVHAGGPESFDDDMDPSDGGERYQRLALMRGKAELVVRTVSWFTDPGGGGFDWVGVYKSADSRDSDYAATEPPAHDDWVLESSTGDPRKLLDLTRKKVRSILREQLAPADLRRAADAGHSTAGLARALGALLPVPTEEDRSKDSSGAPATRRAGGVQRSEKWRLVERGRSIVSTADPADQRWAIEFHAEGPGQWAEVLLLVRVESVDASVTRALRPEQTKVAWWGAAEVHRSGARAFVASGARIRVEFSGPRGRAVSADLTVKNAVTKVWTDEVTD